MRWTARMFRLLTSGFHRRPVLSDDDGRDQRADQNE
jgi:hypothetical protein